MHSFNFQVQFQEETLEKDQAWPVNVGVPGPQHPNICQNLQLRSLTLWREPCYLEQQFLFVQILWFCSCLTIKDL